MRRQHGSAAAFTRGEPRADRPGFVPAAEVARDVTVEVDRRRLVVRGERRDERAEGGDGRRLCELRYDTFRRPFTLPQHVTEDAVSAAYEAGVLTVRVAGAYAGPTAWRIPVRTGAPEETARRALTAGRDFTGTSG